MNVSQVTTSLIVCKCVHFQVLKKHNIDENDKIDKKELESALKDVSEQWTNRSWLH